MGLPTLPAEIFDEIIHVIAHDWDHGPFAVVEDQEYGSDMSWFLKRFDYVVMDQFLMAAKGLNLILYKGLLSMEPVGSALAMVERLLRLLANSCLQNTTRRNRRYISANAIAVGTKAAVNSLAQPGSQDGEDPDTIRRMYFDALVAINMVHMRLRLRNLLQEDYSEEGVLEEKKQESSTVLALAAAAYLGRIDHMERLIAMGADIQGNPSNEWTCPPVMAAALGGQVKTLEHISRCRIDLAGQTDPNGNGALHFAAMGGHTETVKYLIKAGAEPDSQNKSSERPINWAVGAGQLHIFRQLLTRQGARKIGEWSPELLFIRAAKGGHGHIVAELSKRLSKTVLECILVDAMENGSTQVLRTLVESMSDTRPKININYQGSFGRTPLTFAAFFGDIRLVALLLARRDVKKAHIDEEGHTPLIVAARNDNLGALCLLLADPEATADMWRQNIFGQTMLSFAARWGHLNIVERLLDPALGVPKEVVGRAIQLAVRELPGPEGVHTLNTDRIRDGVMLMKDYAAKRGWLLESSSFSSEREEDDNDDPS
ncbi:ankyrin repeat domain-containing protein [Aspergillus mulundensis]|uniref:Uncharacterized protein n=1 Tax=Aspergillus mulundensis TaxID=1810919 RepID=A0A3D8RKN6_9EURO|nr:hypothetical protein DSM5745_07294 [Aspergillus mulundensis]RDW74632.1 hypothetical protein DSM5745_07294 [Aspergillus mulundensis]